MKRKYNYMQFLVRNICYIRGAIFTTNGLCGIKVIRGVCTMSVQAKKKVPQAKWTSSVVKLEHIKRGTFEIK
jgi:hypothetical protein